MADRLNIRLTSDERGLLREMTKAGAHPARSVMLARALLMADRGEGAELPPGARRWTVAEIALTLGICARTVERLKRRYLEGGIEAALERKRALSRRAKFSPADESRIVAIARGRPPLGKERWSARLVAEKAVELGICRSISHMTVQRMLKGAGLGPPPRRPGRPRL